MSRDDRSKPFHRVMVENAFCRVTEKATLIEWDVEPWFDNKGPWTFTIWRTRRSDMESWDKVGEVVNQGYIYDTNPGAYGLGTRLIYRVDITDADGNTYESDPVEAGYNLSHRDWRLLNTILNKEKKLLRKRTGSRGWLLSQPTFGEHSGNRDPNTGEVLTSTSEEDFGTGYVGGFWGPQECFIELDPEKRVSKLTENGKISIVQRTARALAFPRIKPGDVWVNGMTDERFRVEPDISVTANLRGQPIKVSLSLDLIDPTEVVYKFPVPMQV